jgi:hypothetical protein
MAGSVFSRSPISPQAEPMLSLEHATVLWQIFDQRVEPLVRIMYRWATIGLRAKSVDMELYRSLCPSQHALVVAIYYVSAASLTENDCTTLFQKPRSTLLAECQTRCEEALSGTNLFCINDVTTIKAIMFYMVRNWHIRMWYAD